MECTFQNNHSSPSSIPFVILPMLMGVDLMAS